MTLKQGSTAIAAVKLGTDTVTKMYAGADLIYSSATDWDTYEVGAGTTAGYIHTSTLTITYDSSYPYDGTYLDPRLVTSGYANNGSSYYALYADRLAMAPYIAIWITPPEAASGTHGEADTSGWYVYKKNADPNPGGNGTQPYSPYACPTGGGNGSGNGLGLWNNAGDYNVARVLLSNYTGSAGEGGTDSWTDPPFAVTHWDNFDRTGIVRIPSLAAAILTGQRQSTWEVIDDSSDVFGSTSYYPNVSRYNSGLYLGYYNASTDTPPPYIAVWNITKQAWVVDVDGMEQGYWVATSDTIGQMRYNGLGTDFNPLNDNLIVIGYATKQDTSTWADYDGPVTPLTTYNQEITWTLTNTSGENASVSSTGQEIISANRTGGLAWGRAGNPPRNNPRFFNGSEATKASGYVSSSNPGATSELFIFSSGTSSRTWWDHFSIDASYNGGTAVTLDDSGGHVRGSAQPAYVNTAQLNINSGALYTIGDTLKFRVTGENWYTHHTGFIKYYPLFNNSTPQLIQADTVITDKEGSGLNGGSAGTIVRYFDVQSTGDGFPRGIAMWNGNTSTWSSGKMTVQSGNDYAKSITYDVSPPNNNETWLLFLDTEDVDVSSWSAYDGPKADWDTHADGVYVTSQLNTSNHSLIAVPGYAATGYTDAMGSVHVSNDGSGNYTPQSSKYDAFPDGDEPPYVAVYIHNYADTVENYYGSGAQGWYVFENDVATDLSTGYGRTKWETPVAWPSDVSSASGPQDNANGYLGSSQGSHNGHMFVFLDSYTDPVGSGGTDHWSKPPVIVTDTIASVDTTVGDERVWLTDPDQNNPNPIYGGEGQDKLGYYHYASIRGRRWLLYDRGLGSVPYEVYKDSTLMGTGTWNATANDNGVDSLYFTTNSPHASDAAFAADCVVGERMWIILNI